MELKKINIRIHTAQHSYIKNEEETVHHEIDDKC